MLQDPMKTAGAMGQPYQAYVPQHQAHPNPALPQSPLPAQARSFMSFAEGGEVRAEIADQAGFRPTDEEDEMAQQLTQLFSDEEVWASIDDTNIDAGKAADEALALAEQAGVDPQSATLPAMLASAGRQLIDSPQEFRAENPELSKLLDRFAAVPAVVEVLQTMRKPPEDDGLVRWTDPSTGITEVRQPQRRGKPAPDYVRHARQHQAHRDAKAAQAKKYVSDEEKAAKSAAQRQAAADEQNRQSRAKLSRVVPGPYRGGTAARLRARMAAE